MTIFIAGCAGLIDSVLMAAWLTALGEFLVKLQKLNHDCAGLSFTQAWVSPR